MKLQSLSGVAKAVVALSAGGVLAGAIALGASGGGGSAPPAQVVAATATGVPEPALTVEPTPFTSPNFIEPDIAALSSVAAVQSGLQAKGERCPDGNVLYDSVLLNGSFCYPSTWSIAVGDRPLVQPPQRSTEYEFALLVTKTDPATKREVARVSIQIAGPARTSRVDCPQAAPMLVGPLTAKVCFQERKLAAYNSVPQGIARIVIVALPVVVKDSRQPELVTGFQIVDETPGDSSVNFSRQDQEEALGILASLRINP
jgi:hypothetical protein